MYRPELIFRDRRLIGFDWDEGNREKCQQHGVSIVAIERMFDGEIDIRPDLAHSTHEQRFMAVAMSDGRPVFLVFTGRESAGGVLIRPVSARHMHRKEVELYEKTAQGIAGSEDR